MAYLLLSSHSYSSTDGIGTQSLVSLGTFETIDECIKQTKKDMELDAANFVNSYDPADDDEWDDIHTGYTSCDEWFIIGDAALADGQPHTMAVRDYSDNDGNYVHHHMVSIMRL